MTNKTWTWIAVVGLFLIGMLAGWQLTNAFTPKPPQIKHDTIRTPFDTVAFKATLKPTLVAVYKDTGSIHWKDSIRFVPCYKATKADTIRDYTAYHKIAWGKDTLTNDQNLFYEATHGIIQNRLVSFEGRYFWKHPETTVNNNPVQPLKNQLYLGVKLDGLSTGFGIGGTIVLKTKKDAIWSVGIDYIPILSKQPIYSVGRNFKIKL